MSDPFSVNLPAASGISAPSDHSANGLRIWISTTCRYLGLTPTELAKEANLAASTINRFLREEGGNLSARTIDALLEAAKRLEQSSDFWLHREGGDLESRLFEVPIVGEVKAGAFHPLGDWETAKYTVRVPLAAPHYRFLNVGFEVADDHAAPTFPQGTIVTTTLLRGQSILKPKANDYVTVFRGKDTPIKLELTIRRIGASPSNDLWLLPINQSSGLPEVHLGPSETLQFEKIDAARRPIGIITASIRRY